MSFLRRRKVPSVSDEEHRVAAEQESRLVDAEERAASLLQRASLVHAAVTRRDRDNHWRESVERIFLGEA